MPAYAKVGTMHRFWHAVHSLTIGQPGGILSGACISVAVSGYLQKISSSVEQNRQRRVVAYSVERL